MCCTIFLLSNNIVGDIIFVNLNQGGFVVRIVNEVVLDDNWFGTPTVAFQDGGIPICGDTGKYCLLAVPLCNECPEGASLFGLRPLFPILSGDNGPG